MNPAQHTFAERLTELMQMFNLKPTAFAEKLKMSPQMLSGFTGQKQALPNLKTLARIGDTFPRVNMDWLVSGRGEPLKPYPGQEAGTSGVFIGHGHGNAVGAGASANVQVGGLDDCRRELEHWRERAKLAEELALERKRYIDAMDKKN